MPDLAALAQIAPQYAAMLAGQEGQQSQATNQIAQQKALDDIIQQQTLRSNQAQKLPLELEQLAAGNREKDSVTRGNNATAGGQELTNQATLATQPGAIDATNTKNAMASHAAIAQHFNSLADEVEANNGVPPHIALQEALSRKQLPAKASQGINQMFANVPPEQVAKNLRVMGDRIWEETQGMQEKGLETSGALNTAGIHAEAQRDSARILAGGRVEAARATHPDKIFDFEAALGKMTSAKARYAALNDAAAKALEASDMELASAYKRRADALYPQAQAEINNKPQGIDAGAVSGLPVTQPADIRPPGAAPAAAAPVFKSLSELRKTHPEYSGQSDEALKKAYKQKFGVDLK